MKWPLVQLKHVARFGYGDALPTDEVPSGLFSVFGSNGPYGTIGRTNTLGPVIVIGRKGSYGKINWSDEPCFASDTTFYVDASTTRHDLRWLYWLLQTLRLDEGSDEAAVPGLNREEAYARRVPLPSPTAQTTIARFLDIETDKVDRLITAKQRVIDLLTEKRKAIIATAVSRGLDPKVKLRDSGVPWLGEIPEHWEIWKIGHLAKVGNGSTPERDKVAYWREGTYPWLNSSVVNQEEVTSSDQYVTEVAMRECHLPRLRPGTVLVAITGQGKTRGRAVVLSIEATINQHMAFVAPDPTLVDAWFLRWSFYRAYDYLRSISDDAGGTKGALTCEDVVGLRIPVPPPVEQRTIVEHIARQTAQLDAVCVATERTIALLKERRSSLIAAVVTGQLDVGAAA